MPFDNRKEKTMLPVMFLVGVLEMIVVSAWTKAVASQRIWSSGFLTLLNVSLWYFILRVIIDYIDSLLIFGVYALGCALGTMGEIYLAKKKERKQ